MKKAVRGRVRESSMSRRFPLIFYATLMLAACFRKAKAFRFLPVRDACYGRWTWRRKILKQKMDWISASLPPQQRWGDTALSEFVDFNTAPQGDEPRRIFCWAHSLHGRGSLPHDFSILRVRF